MTIASSTFSGIGGGVADIFGSKASKLKAVGNRIEAASYLKAAEFARHSADVTKEALGIKLMQQARQGQHAIGGIEANVAANNMAMSGSALDILADSTAQVALERSVMEKEGTLQVEGYMEQSRALTEMSRSAEVAAKMNERLAQTQKLGGMIKIGSSILSVGGMGMPGGGAPVDPMSGG